MILTNIIAYILVYNILMRIFFKPDYTRFYCGISAFAGKDKMTREQAKTASWKMKILGLYNESRGEHGCGIYANRRWEKGINAEKLFKNFIGREDYTFPIPKDSVMIMHSRQSTMGANTYENTHPFYVESVRGAEEDLLLVHNGTISNIWELCNRHKVDHSKIHSDSLALTVLLDKVGYSVLNEYKGYAALVFTKPAEPNTMYVYHGASKDTANGTRWEERPMFFLKATEGIYFSSMEESLFAIREPKQKVEKLNWNKVFKVADGDFAGVEFDVDRDDANIGINASKSYGGSYSYQSYDRHGYGNYGLLNPPSSNIPLITDTKIDPIIWKETKPENTKKLDKLGVEYIYFWKNRFWNSKTNAKCHGPLLVQKNGAIQDRGNNTAKTYYFYRGVMLSTKIDWESMQRITGYMHSWVNDPKENFASKISLYAAHPVTNLPGESMEVSEFFRYSFYDNLQRAKGGFTAKFGSERSYVLKNGILTTIVPKHKTEKVLDEPIIDPIAIGDIDLFSRDLDKEGWIFDQVVRDVETFKTLMSKIETAALKDFLADELLYASASEPKDRVEPTEKEVEMAFDAALQRAVKHVRTLRFVLNDSTSKSLDVYIELALEREKEEQEARKAMVIDEEELTATDVEKQLLEEAVTVMNDAVDIIGELNTTANELETNLHPIAQECAIELKRGVENLQHGLAELTQKYELKELTTELVKI